MFIRVTAQNVPFTPEPIVAAVAEPVATITLAGPAPTELANMRLSAAADRRRKRRQHRAEGQGRPTLIPRAELLKFDVLIADAEEHYDKLIQLAEVQNIGARLVA